MKALLFIPTTSMSDICHDERISMTEKDPRAVAETIFEREQRREREIGEALRLEEERHAAVMKNMHRLRALRLSREQANTLK